MSMKCLTRKSFLGLTAIALCVGLTAPAARADLVGAPILPNQEIVPLANAPAALATEVLLNSEPVNAALGNPLISANLANAVYRNSLGTLDFLFQVVNSAGSAPIASIAVNNYAGLITGVGYILGGALPAGTPFAQPTAGGVPLIAQRGPAGADILFDAFTITGGSTSNIFFVTTNATNFTQLGSALAAATTSAQGGAVFVTKFSPTAIPEPPVTVMMGLVSLAGLGYHRFRKVRVQA